MKHLFKTPGKIGTAVKSDFKGHFGNRRGPVYKGYTISKKEGQPALPKRILCLTYQLKFHII